MDDFDVWVGGQKLDTIDWRAAKVFADNDDEDVTECPEDVAALLGFDPFADDHLPSTSGRS